ncbi:hypothetical protein FH972_022198 [Carpinus fangiana]|uniref:SUI1 domain-containing protein n=1 Tax=Carpinus fangiana TaxID=176857 RepID=A0A5N6KRJ8_9ROSI|nr:hypothetical protein FH972_022198 [Carpinus fangiana]
MFGIRSFASKDRAGKATRTPRRSYGPDAKTRMLERSIKQSYEKSLPPLTSAIITVVVGKDQRLFAAHEDVLCRAPYFKEACKALFFAPSESKRLSLADEEAETFSCVLEFLYKGDYYPRLLHDKRRNVWYLEGAEDPVLVPSSDRKNEGGIASAVMYHSGVGDLILRDTAVYCAAERFGLEDLKRLALRKQGLQSGIEIKTLSPLRSSDRRKTADRIISDFGLESAQTTDPEDDAAATVSRSALRNAILPDNALSAKFETTHGPELKKINGTVYVGSHGKGEQRVLWIKIEETLYPSGPPFPEKAKQGAIVAVASLDSPSVPLVVGKCVIDVSGLTKAQGAKGQAVETFHWSGDHIWDWSTSGKHGITPPSDIKGWGSNAMTGLADKVESLELEDQAEAEGGVSLQVDEESTSQARNNYIDGEDVVDRIDADADADKISTSDIDHAFKQAFLYGVYQQRENNRSAPKFGLTFPLTQSFVISNLINPYLPTFTPKQAEAYNIKKTSWKNAKKFIKQLDKDKLILSKDTKTEVVILDIDFEDVHFRNFQPYRLPQKDNDTKMNGGASKTQASEEDDSIGQSLKVLNLYRPKETLTPLFKTTSAALKSTYTKAELIPIITTYIESENLISPNNKRIVKLNPFLANSIFSSSSPQAQRADNEILAKGSVPRDILIERVLSTCAPFHAILRNGAEIDVLSSASLKAPNKSKAGLAPRIEIILETRSGNKTATRVHGFEAYQIAPQPLADELRKSCAGSTSVEPWKAAKGNLMEVMVQGPQRDNVVKALERRGIQKAWIDVVDKTKK